MPCDTQMKPRQTISQRADEVRRRAAVTPHRICEDAVTVDFEQRRRVTEPTDREPTGGRCDRPLVAPPHRAPRYRSRNGRHHLCRDTGGRSGRTNRRVRVQAHYGHGFGSRAAGDRARRANGRAHSQPASGRGRRALSRWRGDLAPWPLINRGPVPPGFATGRVRSTAYPPRTCGHSRATWGNG
jgi:hypothetical protein